MGYVLDNIENGKYQNKLPYPEDKAYLIKIEVENNFVGTLAQIEDEIEKRMKKYKMKLVKDRQEYYAENQRLKNSFKEDLEDECGTKGNPKAELLFQKAYKEGHDEGIHCIYNVYIDLVDLIL